jgi:hypothetical protein
MIHSSLFKSKIRTNICAIWIGHFDYYCYIQVAYSDFLNEIFMEAQSCSIYNNCLTQSAWVLINENANKYDR